MKKEIILGTRDSQLAVWQTNWVLERLKELNPDRKFSLKYIKTQGDKILDVALSKIGDKGLFTKELEVALLQGEIDLAVHSLKDIPTQLPDGCIIGCVTKRENSQDVLISPSGYSLKTLPIRAKIGTSSLRRRSQILYYRNDLVLEDLRGNLNTRLRKMVEEDFAAIVLAAAGVIRMGWEDKISEYIPFEISLPAVGQGSLGIEIRKDDPDTQHVISGLHHEPSSYEVLAERSLLEFLEGGCQIPIGALGKVDGDSISLEAMVASLDGSILIREKIIGSTSLSRDLGIQLAKRLLSKGAGEILKQVRQETDSCEK
ncbi:MAG: hydroxymethylbilane synthase [Desulfitibacter sp. BRH_c19]|nr:MAG: hydroxymethylbilane synthase [Desulfitibacter sp. BRH_c19]